MKLWNKRQHPSLHATSRVVRNNFLAASFFSVALAMVVCAVLGIDHRGDGYARPAASATVPLDGPFAERLSSPTARRLSGGGPLSPPSCLHEPEGGVYDLSVWYYIPPFGLVYLFGLLWIFVGIAIVCDTFFEPALDAISTKLRLTKDVAGATFMAAGSSAPEFFTSLADAFISKSGAGIGTIVGSAMFNILIIVAASALLSGQRELAINWRPILRDSSFYLASIFLLFVFMRWGSEEKYFAKDGVGYIEWWEGLVMWLVYVVYILFMTVNSCVFYVCSAGRCCCCRIAPRTGVCKHYGWQFISLKDAKAVDDATEGAAAALELAMKKYAAGDY